MTNDDLIYKGAQFVHTQAPDVDYLELTYAVNKGFVTVYTYKARTLGLDATKDSTINTIEQIRRYIASGRWVPRFDPRLKVSSGL